MLNYILPGTVLAYYSVWAVRSYSIRIPGKSAGTDKLAFLYIHLNLLACQKGAYWQTI